MYLQGLSRTQRRKEETLSHSKNVKDTEISNSQSGQLRSPTLPRPLNKPSVRRGLRNIMASSVALCVVLCLLPSLVHSYCYTAEAKHMEGAGFSIVPYCEYHGMKLGTGTNFEDLKRCEQVSCDNKGRLSVCGTGTNAGVVSLPEGCLLVNDLCVAKVIQDPITGIACPPGLLS